MYRGGVRVDRKEIMKKPNSHLWLFHEVQLIFSSLVELGLGKGEG